MNRILITGGRGGIGLTLTEELASSPKNHIITLGRSTLRDTSEDRQNVTHRRGSILEEDLVFDLLEEEKITHVIHTAGARTSECASDPQAGFEANVLGTDRIFRAAGASSSIERVIHFSTAAVYGNHLRSPSENSILAPPSHYAITKAASEISAQGNTNGANFSTIVLRPGFVIGPHSQGALPTFLREALAGNEATLSFPEQFFLHWAPDLARAVSALLRHQLLADWEIIHPPGIAITLTELRAEIENLRIDLGRTAPIEMSALQHAPFPSSLDQGKFEELVPGFSVTPLAEMLNQIAFSRGQAED